MSWDDDKDGLPASSSEKSFTRADKGKKEELKKKIKEKVGMAKEQDMQKVDLKSQINLHELKNELAGKQDEEAKRKKEDEENAKEKSSAPKTMSQKEHEDAAQQEAHEILDTDELIEQEKQQEELSTEETTPEPG